jgi:phage tail P2-like protein
MMDLTNLDLLKLQTKFMQNNQDVQGFSAALNDQFRQLAEEIQGILTYARIDELPEEILDILAWQFNIDWYDAKSSIEVKRQAVKDALVVSRIRGTPAAVQRVVEIYFGDGRVEEWFEYGGQPYHFRVVTNNPAATNEQAALLAMAVNSVKNLRSRLESVVIESTENMDLYTGFVLHTGDNLTIRQVV